MFSHWLVCANTFLSNSFVPDATQKSGLSFECGLRLLPGGQLTENQVASRCRAYSIAILIESVLLLATGCVPKCVPALYIGHLRYMRLDRMKNAVWNTATVLPLNVIQPIYSAHALSYQLTTPVATKVINQSHPHQLSYSVYSV